MLNTDTRWELYCRIVESYIRDHGRGPGEDVVYQGVPIGKWFAYQRERSNLGLLGASLQNKMNALETLAAQSDTPAYVALYRPEPELPNRIQARRTAAPSPRPRSAAHRTPGVVVRPTPGLSGSHGRPRPAPLRALPDAVPTPTQRPPTPPVLKPVEVIPAPVVVVTEPEIPAPVAVAPEAETSAPAIEDALPTPAPAAETTPADEITTPPAPEEPEHMPQPRTEKRSKRGSDAATESEHAPAPAPRKRSTSAAAAPKPGPAPHKTRSAVRGDGARSEEETLRIRLDALDAFYAEHRRLPLRSEAHLRSGGVSLTWWSWRLPPMLAHGNLPEEWVAPLSAAPWWPLIEARAVTLLEKEAAAETGRAPAKKARNGAAAAVPATPKKARSGIVVLPTAAPKKRNGTAVHAPTVVTVRARPEGSPARAARKVLPEVGLLAVAAPAVPVTVTYAVTVRRVVSRGQLPAVMAALSEQGLVAHAERHVADTFWVGTTVSVADLGVDLERLEALGFEVIGVERSASA